MISSIFITPNYKEFTPISQFTESMCQCRKEAKKKSREELENMLSFDRICPWIRSIFLILVLNTLS
jgi:hypothetical protein